MVNADMPFQWEVMRMADNIDNLRLCSTFNSTQLKRAMGNGLPFVAMSLSQQQTFADLLRRVKPDLPDDTLARCIFAVSEESKVQTVNEDETNRPVKIQQRWFYFTYTFAQGDQKRSGISLGSERLKESPPPAASK